MTTRKLPPPLPAHVKIGPYGYTIEAVRDLADHDRVSFLYGHHDAQKQLIRLDARNTRDRHAVVLVHECLHGLGQQLPTDLSEEQVTHLAPLLVAFLRDNPAVVDYLLSRAEAP